MNTLHLGPTKIIWNHWHCCQWVWRSPFSRAGQLAKHFAQIALFKVHSYRADAFCLLLAKVDFTRQAPGGKTQTTFGVDEALVQRFFIKLVADSECDDVEKRLAIQWVSELMNELMEKFVFMNTTVQWPG